MSVRLIMENELVSLSCSLCNESLGSEIGGKAHAVLYNHLQECPERMIDDYAWRCGCFTRNYKLWRESLPNEFIACFKHWGMQA